MFIHLKKTSKSSFWIRIDRQDPTDRKTLPPLLPYGVQREIQRRLAAVRTDLDSFSDAEAYALMCSGYLMTEDALNSDAALGFDVPKGQRESWQFLQIDNLMKQAVDGNPLVNQLKVSDKLFWKARSLLRWLRVLGWVVGAGLALGLYLILVNFWTNKLPSFSWAS